MPAHHPGRDPDPLGDARPGTDPDPDPGTGADARPAAPPPAARTLVVVLDVANVVGSRPDGWWRDRAGAALRLVEASAGIVGRSVPDPDGGGPRRVGEVVAVVEGRAREVAAPQDATGRPPAGGGTAGAADGVVGRVVGGAVRVVAALADGDTTVVAVAGELLAAGHDVRVVTADRGLRARLPAGVLTSGPGWWNDLLGR